MLLAYLVWCCVGRWWSAAWLDPNESGGCAPPLLAPLVLTTTHEEDPGSRVRLVPPPPAGPRVAIDDAVTLQVMESGRSGLAACVRRAQQRDPSAVPRRIDVALEVDAEGVVTGAKVELEDVRLAACLSAVSRGLHFPSPGKPATASLVFVAR